MAVSVEPKSGLNYGWSLGETPWNEGMDANLLRIGRVGFHLTVKDRDLATPPGTPSDGDTYIVAASGTGDWAGLDGHVVVWDDTASAWVDFTPGTGWVAFIEDEFKLSAYYSSAWSAGIAI